MDRRIKAGVAKPDRPEFHPWNPHGVRRELPPPRSSSDLHTRTHTLWHVYLLNLFNESVIKNKNSAGMVAHAYNRSH